MDPGPCLEGIMLGGQPLLQAGVLGLRSCFDGKLKFRILGQNVHQDQENPLKDPKIHAFILSKYCRVWGSKMHKMQAWWSLLQRLCWCWWWWYVPIVAPPSFTPSSAAVGVQQRLWPWWGCSAFSKIGKYLCNFQGLVGLANFVLVDEKTKTKFSQDPFFLLDRGARLLGWWRLTLLQVVVTPIDARWRLAGDDSPKVRHQTKWPRHLKVGSERFKALGPLGGYQIWHPSFLAEKKESFQSLIRPARLCEFARGHALLLGDDSSGPLGALLHGAGCSRSRA